MEHSIVNNISHEQISLHFMQQLNEEFNQSLTLAIKIFKGEYHRKFMNQLISGQFDMDRADYLKRDSFYTGVAEGNINSDRLIAMLNVIDDELVIEEKGIYSVEKFLVARRLMYWQVYLHKTSLVAEQLLIRVLKRAKELAESGVVVNASTPLTFFLKNKIDKASFDSNVLSTFASLDDYDIVSAMKEWMHHEDFVLSNLCEMIINRTLLKITIKSDPFSEEKIKSRLSKVCQKYGLSDHEASYFVFSGKIANQAYSSEQQNIHVYFKNGKIKDIVEASDQLNLKALTTTVNKYFLCYPKLKK
jgi:hypothetical protein